ncbi:proton-conducting transporter transmembrane domain-containing protein [Pseudomonas sp. SST3]|uniref:proton-conducting transporter transmembrane domain-containing protein n=1 Tax=Pseudomonas sp. SST3 TaxID=2267882 RepID=UPI000DFE13D8|nr:proton-conducting transporter membrane subunit [Pseudomonas sp. SST3]NKQ09111.1 sodium:proton antiporter [Pseudomonas sp. SST3]
MNAWLWLLVPVAPLLAGLGLLIWRERALGWLWLGCVPALAMVVWPMPALDLPMLWEGVRWGTVDELSRAWLGFTALLWGCAGIFAVSSQRDDPKRMRFWTFWLLALSGNLLLIITTDALSFYLGFSAMSLSAYGLIVHQGGPGPRRAGRLYLQLAICGEMALLAALMLRSHAADGDFAFAAWRALPMDGLTLLLLLIGLGLKAGFWPLHVWLPLAHPAAPAPASAVLSGAMLKAGFLGLWRCLPEQDPLLSSWAEVLLAVGIFGTIYPALLGLLANKAKAALAYSSVSQMGYLLMLLALVWRHPEQLQALTTVMILYGVHHGLAKGALFLAAGLIHAGRLPRICWLLLAVPALAIIGLPLTSGGAVKTALKESWRAGTFEAWLPWLSFSSLTTALLLTRALWLLRRDAQEAPASWPPLAQLLPWALLSSLALLLPWLWPALREPMLHGLYPSGIWAALWPLLLTLILAMLALRLGWNVPSRLAAGPKLTLWLSLRLKRLVQRPPLAVPSADPDQPRWRQRERHWNRLWNTGTLAMSAWLLVALLWLGWLW